MPQTSSNSLTTQKMIDEHIQPETLTPSLHTVLSDVKKSLNQLLETFKSQFAQDETGIGTTHLTKMQVDKTRVTQNLTHRGHTPSLQSTMTG